MRIVDFSRAWVTFRIDALRVAPQTVSHRPPYTLNNARIQLECVCDVRCKRTGARDRFVLGASCKTERVGVAEQIWTYPNADFAPIFSTTRFLNIKTFAHAGIQVPSYPPGSGLQPARQSGQVAETFDDVRIDIAERPARPLHSSDDIVRAVLENQPLVATTALESPTTAATLQYPVKTINANERDGIYQTDTGPVLWPDLACPFEQLIERFELAYVAFNSPEWCESLIRRPTSIADGVEVFHYGESLRVDSQNLLWTPLT